jgi:hypothetical protein
MHISYFAKGDIINTVEAESEKIWSGRHMEVWYDQSKGKVRIVNQLLPHEHTDSDMKFLFNVAYGEYMSAEKIIERLDEL